MDWRLVLQVKKKAFLHWTIRCARKISLNSENQSLRPLTRTHRSIPWPFLKTPSTRRCSYQSILVRNNQTLELRPCALPSKVFLEVHELAEAPHDRCALQLSNLISLSSLILFPRSHSWPLLWILSTWLEGVVSSRNLKLPPIREANVNAYC